MQVVEVMSLRQEGWQVSVADVTLRFRSGREAEAEARRIAGRLARAGHEVRVSITSSQGDALAMLQYRPGSSEPVAHWI